MYVQYCKSVQYGVYIFGPCQDAYVQHNVLSL